MFQPKLIQSAMIFAFVFIHNTANAISLPADAAFSELITSFKFTTKAYSADGKKIHWNAHLKPNTWFTWSGIFFGHEDSKHNCAARGGRMDIKLEQVERQELMQLSLAAFNENQEFLSDLSEQERKNLARKRLSFERSISVEVNKEIGHNHLVQSGKHFLAFKRKLHEKFDILIKNDVNITAGLALEIMAFKNNHLEVQLINIGKRPVTLVLPENAGTHFVLKSNKEIIPLSYKKPVIKPVIELGPGKKHKLSFNVPVGTDKLQNIYLHYDNIAPLKVIEENKSFENGLKLNLCAPLIGGQK